jgi:SAM-dependent methyltransferase
MYGVIDSIQKFVRRINKPKDPRYCIAVQWKRFSMIDELISGKKGLEIGGPTRLFKRWNWLPLYRSVGSLDNCNFSNSTRWEGTIQGGLTYDYDRKHKPGRQYILEITDLEPIKAESYDFVISSHVLEHTSNPLKALTEIRRLIKNNGILLLIFPHKDGAFDHKRSVTTIEHLLEDFRDDVSEEDLTHLQEILDHHDLGRDPWAGDFETFKSRSECNSESRCLHHHVFDTRLAAELVNWLGMEILFVEPALPGDIIVAARKVEHSIQNEPFLGDEAPHLLSSPFVSDHILRL